MNVKQKIATKPFETQRENVASQKEKNRVSRNTSSPIDHFSFLPRTIGNQAVQKLFLPGVIQAKLEIGQPNDKYEQEAESIVGIAMQMPETRVQQLEKGGKEEQILQTKEVPGRVLDVTPDLESRIHALKGGGRPLPESVVAFLEPRFGYDFSHVRIHTNPEAARLARALKARAFTVGRDVVFNTGQYAPETPEGKQLLGHELVHVVQQQDHVAPEESRLRRRPVTSIRERGLKAAMIQRASTQVGEEIYYDSKKEAVRNVPKHVVPRECFVWYTGKRGPAGYPWKVISGTGCAHWVAHQLGIKSPVACSEGYAIRRPDLFRDVRRTEHTIRQAKVGDIWILDRGEIHHSGIVRAVHKMPFGNVGSVMVEHDSNVGEVGVITSEVTEGRFFTNPKTLGTRIPSAAEKIPPEAGGIPAKAIGRSMSFGSAVAMQTSFLEQITQVSVDSIVETVDMLIGEAQDKVGILEWLEDTKAKVKETVKERGEPIGKNLREKQGLSHYERLYKESVGKGVAADKVVREALGKRPRPKIKISRWAGLLKAAGRVLMFLEFALAGVKTFLAPREERLRTGLTEVARIGGAMVFGAAGGYAGSSAGAAIGGLFGSVFGIPGSVIGGAIGALIGGGVAGGFGGWLGERLVEWLYENLPPSDCALEGNYTQEER